MVLSVTTCSYGVDSGALTEPWGEPVPASTEDARRFPTRGVDRLQAVPESGAIERLTLENGEQVAAELFVDCSGFFYSSLAWKRDSGRGNFFICTEGITLPCMHVAPM